MAEGLNKVMLLGNLGADPELKVTQGGQSVLKLRLATTETYLDRNKTRQERTEWHQITLWGPRGEALSKFLAKGERIFVEGRIQTSSYEKDGEKRYRTEIVATNIILSGGGKSRSGGGDYADSGESRGSGGGGGGARPQQRAPQQQSAPPQDDFGGGDFGGSGGGDDDIPF
jgi:single-strand DNA-binding protein